LFTSEGALWRRQRKLMASLFQPAQLPTYAPAMTASALRCLSTWEDGQTVDLVREATRITMNVAGSTLFGADLFDEADALGAALTVTLRWAARAAERPAVLGQVELAGVLERAAERLPGGLGSSVRGLSGRLDAPILWPTARNRELRRALQVVEEQVHRLIAERRGGEDAHPDLMSRLLKAHAGEGEATLSDTQVRDEIVTLFVAGHETTATALAWTFHLLGRHPEIYARLCEEIEAFGPAVPTAEDLPRLGYAQRVFKEALRRFPPVPFLEREALTDFDLGGHPIRRGTYLLVLPWALHHRKELWPDPERFDPDRFLPEAERGRDRHAWIPFGAGPRVCIGNGFALMEGTLVLATLLQRASLDPVDSTELLPDPAAATFRPLGPVRMRVRLRRAVAPAASV
jgi:cytochrome P450